MNRFQYNGDLGKFILYVSDTDQATQIRIVISRRVSSILIPIQINGKDKMINSDDLDFIK